MSLNRQKIYDEWMKQSDYDLGTASDMLRSGRNIYAIFMCHLAIEKALKAYIIKQTGEYPLKTHSLGFLLETSGLEPVDDFAETIFSLDRVSVPVRYPEDLDQLMNVYDKNKAQQVLDQSTEIQTWIKGQ